MMSERERGGRLAKRCFTYTCNNDIHLVVLRFKHFHALRVVRDWYQIQHTEREIFQNSIK